MRRVRFEISAAAVLLAALLYFFDATGAVSALVPAALTHELGHILALRLCESRVTRVRVGLTGLELDYAPGLDGGKRALCCLAGPLSGFLYAAACLAARGAFLRMSGAISLLLTCFNLLPTLPLDGGRCAAALLPERAARALSCCTAFLLALTGCWLALRYGSVSLCVMGAWLSVCNLRRSD